MFRERDFVRPPAVAGTFYPEDKLELQKNCEMLLARARSETPALEHGEPFAIVSPHAGYPYSGFTAAHGYSLLKENEFETVAVVSPSHREYFEGISVFSGGAYSTPLGDIPVDTELRDLFLEKTGDVAIESRAGHKDEHALEVQLPFLQLSLGKFNLLPIVMGDQRPEFCRTLGMVLADLAKQKHLLVVASSDLSHYYNYDIANEIDGITMKHVSELNPDEFLVDVANRRCEACGAGPIAACMYAGIKVGRKRMAVLHHCNSGDTTGDKFAVVGYMSAVIS